MQTLLIGRDPTSQIVINDNLVSRNHAQLTILDNGQVSLKDLGSSNGTFVNGSRITERYLKPGDVVKCGAAFLNWAQYISRQVAGAGYAHEVLQPAYSVGPVEHEVVAYSYSVSDVFKYLTLRIFEIGDLFKTNWNRTPSIILLNSIPVAITFIVSVILFASVRYGSFYISPTILVGLLFGVCPFLGLFLLSIGKKVPVDKVALASGIAGFLQFSSLLSASLYVRIGTNYWNTDSAYFLFNHYQSSGNFGLAAILITIVFIVLIINITIAFYLFIYKYFVSIGFARSRSIYLIMISCGITAFFQVLSFYIVFLIAKDSF